MATSQPHPGLIDSDVLIDYTRGVADAAAFLNSRRAVGDFRTSIVSAMELLRGCLNRVEQRLVERLLASLDVLPISETVSRRAYALIETYSLSHSLEIADALIAATALQNDLTLYTLNVRDFRMIASLDLVRPY